MNKHVNNTSENLLIQLDFKESDFLKDQQTPNFIQRSVMPVVKEIDGIFTSLGTAFCITSNGLMLTALHVINETLIQGTPYENGYIPFKVKDNIKLYVLYCTETINEDGEKGEYCSLIPISHASISNLTDIVLLELNVNLNNNLIQFMTLSLSPDFPIVNQDTVAVGYSKTISTSNPIDIVTVYKNSLNFSQGKIEEVFPFSRDSIIMSYPCFRTNAKYEHGMSGGPIFAENGSVAGIVSRSMEICDDNVPETSHAASITAALTLSGKVNDINYHIYELIHKGYVKADKSFSNLIITKKEDGVHTITYKNLKSN